MTLDEKIKVRFEYGDLERDIAVQRLEEAGFRIIRMRHNPGLFGEYRGSREEYENACSALLEEGIQIVYREVRAKHDSSESG